MTRVTNGIWLWVPAAQERKKSQIELRTYHSPGWSMNCGSEQKHNAGIRVALTKTEHSCVHMHDSERAAGTGHTPRAKRQRPQAQAGMAGPSHNHERTHRRNGRVREGVQKGRVRVPEVQFAGANQAKHSSIEEGGEGASTQSCAKVGRKAQEHRLGNASDTHKKDDLQQAGRAG